MTTPANIDDLTMEQLANMSDEDLAKLESGEPVQQDQAAAGNASVTEASQSQADGDKTAKGDESSNTVDDQPAGVATKAGDKIIPYAVLEQTRAEKSKAELRANELEQQKAAAEAAAEELRKQLQTATTANVGDIQLMSEDELAALAEDLPEVANNIRAMQAQVKALSAKVVHHETTAEEDARAQQAQTAQEAIDSVPKLAFIQSSNPDLFELAKKYDNEFKQDPEMQKLTLTQRFEKVVERIESTIGGEIKLGGQKQPGKKQEEAPILSLSDIPGGANPAEESTVADDTATQVSMIDKMSKMTPDQLDAYLSS